MPMGVTSGFLLSCLRTNLRGPGGHQNEVGALVHLVCGYESGLVPWTVWESALPCEERHLASHLLGPCVFLALPAVSHPTWGVSRAGTVLLIYTRTPTSPHPGARGKEVTRLGCGLFQIPDALCFDLYPHLSSLPHAVVGMGVLGLDHH